MELLIYAQKATQLLFKIWTKTYVMHNVVTIHFVCWLEIVFWDIV